jgi:hypothetical protein
MGDVKHSLGVDGSLAGSASERHRPVSLESTHVTVPSTCLFFHLHPCTSLFIHVNFTASQRQTGAALMVCCTLSAASVL